MHPFKIIALCLLVDFVFAVVVGKWIKYGHRKV